MGHSAQRLLVLLLLIFCGLELTAQERYFVHFRDKPAAGEALTGFDAKAIERRLRHGIPFPMEDDLPVHAPYVREVEDLVSRLRFVLRWPNAVSVEAFPDQVEKLRALPFVEWVEPFEESETRLASWNTEEGLPDPGDPARQKKMEKLYALQCKLTHLDTLWAAGLTGKGVRIAVFDAGFKEVDEHPAFRRMRDDGHLIAARDFYRGHKPMKHSLHGTAVLGCIVGWWDDKRIGSAVDAEILLARTEYGPAERRREQDAWMAAAEWADQEGADIISSSLGYSRPLHTYAEMDGRSTTVAKAAAHAVRKGILVVNSAGNQGDEKFHYVSSPGDVDSVLTVGASFPMLRFPMPFSSFGPNAAGVAKPDLSGPGYVLSAGRTGEIDFFSGTSFACPTVAGIAACLLQRDPRLTNMDLRDILVRTAHLHPYYDYVMGHGVIDARRMLGAGPDSVAPTFSLSFLADTLVVTFDSLVLGPDSLFDINGKPFHFHVADPQGHLLEYRYLRITKGLRAIGIPPDRRPRGMLRLWFEGYLKEVPDESELRK